MIALCDSYSNHAGRHEYERMLLVAALASGYSSAASSDSAGCNTLCSYATVFVEPLAIVVFPQSTKNLRVSFGNPLNLLIVSPCVVVVAISRELQPFFSANCEEVPR